jgi:hypothetical protein
MVILAPSPNLGEGWGEVENNLYNIGKLLKIMKYSPTLDNIYLWVYTHK